MIVDYPGQYTTALTLKVWKVNTYKYYNTDDLK